MTLPPRTSDETGDNSTARSLNGLFPNSLAPEINNIKNVHLYTTPESSCLQILLSHPCRNDQTVSVSCLSRGKIKDNLH